MLLAYLDEIGHAGAFISHQHKRFNDGPAFGYGGFVIPEENAREFSAKVEKTKRELCAEEIPEDVDPGRWEKKGSDLLFAMANKERPQNLRTLGGLVATLRRLNGSVFYYAAEKPIGSPKETNCGTAEFAQRESDAMRETLNRLARHADGLDQEIMILMDQINEKSRKQRLPEMYAHIFWRGVEHRDMRRIVEPPMHIDSDLSSNIQFADWVCAFVKRAIGYQLTTDSRYEWAVTDKKLDAFRKAFTYESKLHLWNRSIDDLHHSEILSTDRPVISPKCSALHSEDNKAKLEMVRKAAIRAQQRR